MQLPTLPKFRIRLFLIIVPLILLFGAGIWIYKTQPSFISTVQQFIERIMGRNPQQKEFIYILPHGRQEYSAQFGPAVTGPKIQKVIIDPLDAKQGEKITVTIQIAHNSPVTKAAGILITDHKQLPADFSLITGNQAKGTWETSWILSDSNDAIYQLAFTLVSETGNWEGSMAFR